MPRGTASTAPHPPHGTRAGPGGSGSARRGRRGHELRRERLRRGAVRAGELRQPALHLQRLPAPGAPHLQEVLLRLPRGRRRRGIHPQPRGAGGWDRVHSRRFAGKCVAGGVGADRRILGPWLSLQVGPAHRLATPIRSRIFLRSHFRLFFFPRRLGEDPRVFLTRTRSLLMSCSDAVSDCSTEEAQKTGSRVQRHRPPTNQTKASVTTSTDHRNKQWRFRNRRGVEFLLSLLFFLPLLVPHSFSSKWRGLKGAPLFMEV